jgi:DNA-binding LacI/PurR family transcriptional regulator
MMETLQKLHFPFVMIGRCQDNHELSFIDFDFEKAVIQAYAHLLELGHKKIGFFTFPESWHNARLGPAVRAKLGFQEVIRRYNLEPIFYESNLSVEDSRSCVKEAIDQHPDMTAIVALHNTIAVGAINAIHGSGKRVPEDYSIFGVALGQESDLIIPPLTAIPWEGYHIGQQAASILIQKLNTNEPVIEQFLVLPKIEMRCSTASYSP